MKCDCSIKVINMTIESSIVYILYNIDYRL